MLVMRNKEETLVDIINNDSYNRIEAYMAQNNFSSKLVFNKTTQNVSITTSDFMLAYLPESFNAAREDYFKYQSLAHQVYHHWAYNEFFQMHTDMSELIDFCKARGVDEYVKVDAIYNTLLFFRKIINAPGTLYKYRTTNKKMAIESVKDAKMNLDNCITLNNIMNYGKNLLDYHIPRFNGNISAEAKENLLNWQKTQGQIAFLYYQMTWIAKQILHTKEAAFKQMYPGSGYIFSEVKI